MEEDTYILKNYYESINGKTIKLKINKYSNATEIIVNNKYNVNVYKKCKLLLLILIFNLIAFLMNVVNVNYFLILLMITTFFLYQIFNVVQYESLLVVPQLGCQVEVRYVLGRIMNFIPYSIIDGIFINEVISKQRILFVLSILIKENEKCSYLIPLFTATNPRLNCIEVIYQNLQNVIQT